MARANRHPNQDRRLDGLVQMEVELGRDRPVVFPKRNH